MRGGQLGWIPGVLNPRIGTVSTAHQGEGRDGSIKAGRALRDLLGLPGEKLRTHKGEGRFLKVILIGSDS